VINDQEIQAMLRSAEALHRAGRLEDTERACRDILVRHPDHAETLHLFGIILGQLGKTEESVRVLRRAVQLQPDSALVRHNLAFALKLAGNFDEAVAEFHRAIALDPYLASAHSNLGITYKDMLRLDEAIPCYRRAIQLRPDYAEAHWNLGLVLLRLGDFKEGLAEYEWRGKVKSLMPLPTFAQPRWNGEHFFGKTILLFPEQGLGDAIQFARYIPMVANRGRQVVLVSRPELVRVFERSFKMAHVVPLTGPIPNFHVQCSLVSLPLVFGTDLNSIPAPIPYVQSDPALVESWSRKLGSRDGRLRVGLAWAGNSNHINDRNRSIGPSELAPLAAVKEAALYSLQKDKPGDRTAPADLNLIDFTAELGDFAETAALIENLELVVTVDTSVAHLAGAMGKPTWVLVPFVPDWRWLLDRSDSPWYPGTMRLFRQAANGQWKEAVESVVSELRKLVTSGK
jgi:tetratricopeptide (TPR) repeat protein